MDANPSPQPHTPQYGRQPFPSAPNVWRPTLPLARHAPVWRPTLPLSPQRHRRQAIPHAPVGWPTLSLMSA
eukprot:60250-Chlamydomonas_euryale.AAC.1